MKLSRKTNLVEIQEEKLNYYRKQLELFSFTLCVHVYVYVCVCVCERAPMQETVLGWTSYFCGWCCHGECVICQLKEGASLLVSFN